MWFGPNGRDGSRSNPVSGLLGSLVHGQAVTLNGSGFGTKSRSLTPLVRDVGAAATGTLDPQWSGGYPDGPAGDPQIIQNHDVGYSASGATIGAPHPYVPRILSGIHGQVAVAIDLGEAVGPFVGFSQPTNPYALYLSYYYCEDRNWVYDLNTPKDNNNKMVNWSPGSNPFHVIGSVGDVQHSTSVSEYTDPSTGQNSAPYNNTLPGQWILQNGASQGPIETPDRNGHGAFWGTKPNPANPAAGLVQANNWHKMEHQLLLDFTNGPSGYAYWKQWQNGVQVMNYQGSTDFAAGLSTTRSVMLSSYSRNQGNAFNARYLADMTVDLSATLTASNASSIATIWAGDNPIWANCVIREVQVADLWNNTQIHIPAFWRGALPSGLIWFHVQSEAGVITPIGSYAI